jgi:2-carboxy-1,4-naphthoquinone phytyltransferase
MTSSPGVPPQPVQPHKKLPNKKLWMAALKPPMYSVAMMPIMVGAALAYFETGVFHGIPFFTFLISAVLLLVWENLCNDVFDSDTGIDRNKHHSLVNMTQNRSLIFGLANLCGIAGIVGILSIALSQNDWTVLGLVLGCCALGYLYQGPPFRLGYQGLGEPLCVVSFALGVAAAYYAQVQQFSLACWLVAFVIGMTTMLVLFCSHFHQGEDDLAAGKRSPIVRLGTLRAAQLVPWFCASIFGALLVAVGLGWLPLGSLLVLLSTPFAFKLCRHLLRYHNQPAAIKNAKFVAIAFHSTSGLLLCLGFLFSAGQKAGLS